MITYKDAGVDIEAGDDLVERISARTKATYSENVLAGIGGFSALVKIPAGMKEPVLVSGTDGVGTKLKIAFATGRHDTVGIDLVAMCVNDVVTCGAEPLFFLDYFATGKLRLEVAEQVIGGIIEGCRRAGCPLVGGETAEMPDMYAEGEYDLAGFAVGIVDRSRILRGDLVRPGDAVLGFPSTGLHSNGYSLVRRLLLDRLKLPLEGHVPELGCSLAEELLRPTMIYAGHVRALAAAGGLRSLAHITGGGLPGNAARTIPQDTALLLRRGSWPVPPIFTFIEERGVPREEMLRTFNMGLGLVAVVAGESAAACMARLKEEGIEAFAVGKVVPRGEGRPEVGFES
jgi:phosphoribosylformylglycinamidine cyclo-ligase